MEHIVLIDPITEGRPLVLSEGVANQNKIRDAINGLIDGKSDTNHNHDTAYLGLTAKAADSDKLDGMHAGQNGTNYVPYVDVRGSIGIGTAPSGWSGIKALQFSGSYAVSDADNLFICRNCYYDGTVWRFIQTAAARAQYSLYSSNGSIYTYISDSDAVANGIVSWVETLLIDSAGNTRFGGMTSTVSINNTYSRSYSPSLSDAIAYFAKATSTNRSINAAGTINASGADYAEYMTKADDCGDIAKGDICGIDSEGKLTDRWANAVHFAIKSTDPAYVGGDTWGTEEIVGVKPVKPERREAKTEYRLIQEAQEASTILDGNGNPLTTAIPEIYGTVILESAETDEEFAERMVEYEVALSEWTERHEAERKKVDRIAFCGQVPVNIYEFTLGDFIIPAESDGGGITAVAVSEDQLTNIQYIKSLGKIIARDADGRARIIVKAI